MNTFFGSVVGLLSQVVFVFSEVVFSCLPPKTPKHWPFMNNYCLDALQPTPGRTVDASVLDALAGGNAIRKAIRESTNSSSVTPSGSFTQVPGISIFIRLKCICKYVTFRSFQEKIEKTIHATSISFGIFNTHVMVHLQCYYPNVLAPSVYLVISTPKKNNSRPSKWHKGPS